jgi:hypothetical protein
MVYSSNQLYLVYFCIRTRLNTSQCHTFYANDIYHYIMSVTISNISQVAKYHQHHAQLHVCQWHCKYNYILVSHKTCSFVYQTINRVVNKQSPAMISKRLSVVYACLMHSVVLKCMRKTIKTDACFVLISSKHVRHIGINKIYSTFYYKHY